jgi:uncharacterized protein (TIGR02099 family)
MTRLSTEINIKLPAPLPASPFRRLWLHRLAQLLLWLATFAYFAFALILLTLRYAVLPQIENYRGDIEQMLTSSLNLPVAIARIDAHWQGLLPHLALHGLEVRDQQGRPALAFDNVVADVSWTSLLYFNLRLYRLEIVAPALTIRRDAEGRIFIAGLQLNTPTPQNQNDFSDWLLAQHRVVVSDASIIWVDELRGAAPLELQHLNFHLQNDGSRHRFGFTADPPRTLAARLDVRGDFRGEDLDDLGPWKGEAYAELDYADLSAWRQWVDYPVELPQGSGAMRLWLGFADRQLTRATADIAMDNVQVRLARDLPLLDLQNLTGRLSGKRMPQGFELAAKHLALTTRDGINVAPSDFQLRWSDAIGHTPARGEFSADGLDLNALARLAGYLPFPAAMRQQLADVAPRGKVFDLKSSWMLPENSGDIPSGYSLSARFERLGMHALGSLPGFEGVSGSIDGNEQGGVISLASRDAVLELPNVFADPRIDLAVLNLQSRWKVLKEITENAEKEHEKVEVVIEQAAFENRDAAGVASGRYVASAGEPGEIDLNARLSRGNGNAVWRYIPLAVGKNVRDWLHEAILGGVSNETTLRLRGNLRNFPFADGSGVFEVKGKFHGGSLRYVSSWPQIGNITGELEFVGKHMLIKASNGNIFGTTLSDVKVEIADLSARDNALVIVGKAAGPTGDFLRFIENSPVGDAIDHFTEDMTASGNGHLDLSLMLPLQHLADTQVEGSYQFAGNRLKVDTDLPPLTEVNGRLKFTGDTLKAERVRANLLGMPMVFDVKTAANAGVSVNAEGALNIAELRKQFTHPLLDHLSGSTVWHGSVVARKKNADVMVESKLQGISSSLPAPFNKSAGEALPLRFERKLLPKPVRPASAKPAAVALAAVPRDQIELSLGNAVAARFVRRHEGERGEKVVWERGAVALGEPLAVPDKGMLLAVNLPKIDVDYWRSMLPKPSGENGSAPAELPLTVTALTLKTPELTAFGRSINDLDLRAGFSRESGWRAEIKSRDLNGELIWRGQGSGRLSGHLRQLVINEASPASGASTAGNAAQSPVDEMPGLDIEVDQFLLHGKPLGKLKLIADNRDGTWDAKLDIENDDGKLSGEGKWRPSTTQPDTQLKFSLNAKSIEKLLTRLGYSDAVRRGRATLEGNLSWNGTPYMLDYPSLNGTLNLDAANGQFNKLEPGVGRLLGILSLQSLPRRITLDFRDIFSEGFAFDSIAGQFNLSHGVMDTQNLQIQGPAAKVLMSGSVSLPHETQNLKVRVQPAISETLSVGWMLANPAAGAIAWLAQKVLQDPLGQAFAFEYSITGTWADPKVTKLAGPQLNGESAAKPN